MPTFFHADNTKLQIQTFVVAKLKIYLSEARRNDNSPH